MHELGIEADFSKKPAAHKSNDLPTKEIGPLQLSLVLGFCGQFRGKAIVSDEKWRRLNAWRMPAPSG